MLVVCVVLTKCTCVEEFELEITEARASLNQGYFNLMPHSHLVVSCVFQ